MQQSYVLKSPDATIELGKRIAKNLKGGEVFDLRGDIGAGKTVFTKGLAVGLGIDAVVQSPTYTIAQEYLAAGDKTLVHFDFYRLEDAGIMRDELAEVLQDNDNVVVIEWDNTVRDLLPKERTVEVVFQLEEAGVRKITIKTSGQLTYALAEVKI